MKTYIITENLLIKSQKQWKKQFYKKTQLNKIATQNIYNYLKKAM